MENINDILPLVEQPSRYLGTEANRIKKNFDQIKLKIALAFPDMYEIGTSHFGMQILYDILNRHQDIAAERVFAPAADMADRLRQAGIPLVSLESGLALGRFDIIGFSLLYELNYTNILAMLDLAGIPFYAADRDEQWPLIIAGGPCVCNPEPLADFFDAMVVGDGEYVIVEMARAWMEWKESGGKKETLLKRWAAIEGVYIPCFFEPRFDASGFQTLLPRFPEYDRVKRTVVPDLNTAPFPAAPVVPFGRPVHDRLRIEVARGCTRGCRFCQAGIIYRPTRERSPEILLTLLESAIRATGYEDLSLLSLSTGDYGCIACLMQRIMEKYASERIAVSLPSLRAGTLTPEIMELIKKVRKTGFTIAPEAGSQRLRNAINKNITEDEILTAVEQAFKAGWQVIKLYFMIGLPAENHEDIQAIPELVRTLKEVKGLKKRKGKINVSVGTFIPKPHTPFQWARQISLAESIEKIEWLKGRLRMPEIQFKWQRPELSLIEGVWARGDRRLSGLLVSAYRKGCRFDGWTEQFRFDLWRSAFEEAGADMAFYTARARDLDEPLPWDHIDTGTTKAFLQSEWAKALTGESTADCRDGVCNACGVCDFERIEPRVFKPIELKTAEPEHAPASEMVYKTLHISYARRGPAQYFGHLELVNIFLRAIRRACIPVKYSEGFHPMPKVSFHDPLPIGMESQGESFYITVADSVKPGEIPHRLNPYLPEGIQVLDCQIALSRSARKKPDAENFEITLKTGEFDQDRIQAFRQMSERILTRVRPNGKVRKIDLKKAILDMELLAPNRLRMTLSNADGQMIRPAEAVREIFGMDSDPIRQAQILKL